MKNLKGSPENIFFLLVFLLLFDNLVTVTIKLVTDLKRTKKKKKKTYFNNPQEEITFF